MKRSSLIAVGILAAILGTVLCGSAAAEGGRPLWEIGKADRNTAEFALGPNGYAQFAEDPLFVVGASDAKRDWPYVQPGPSDAWAGGRGHTFAIVFAVGERLAEGTCRLGIDLADTQGKTPPVLRIAVNGREVFKQQMPAGGADASVFGDPTQGKPHRVAVDFPVALLSAGANEITIETLSGSWVLYDHLELVAPAGVTLAAMPPATFVHRVASLPVLVEKNGRLWQTVQMQVRHFGDPAEATVSITGAEPVRLAMKPGSQTVEFPLPAVEAETPVTAEVTVAGKTTARQQVVLKPARKWVVYLLPHSHVDIGYTKVQTEVERDHWQYYQQALDASRRTADYPPGAQFKWNVEVLWAVDSYLRQAPPEKQQEFVEAVRKGWIGLDALYGNELTALCRPEELVRLVDYAQRVSRRCGVAVDSAMISDVPGYTWGLMSVFAAGGVKYMSIGPNGGDRIGYTLEAWADKPFYWVAPGGRQKVLCWIPDKGYWRAFDTGPQLFDRLARLESSGYPYEMVQVRYCLGDNAGPALDLCETVKKWNAEHAYPKLIIGTTSEMMREFERRYADKIPQAAGDFTPYWEDGAASSALETGLNRAAAERLAQAEALWAMASPKTYPADDFYAAWRNAVLYDEHTWGAHCSISQPDSDFTKAQWAIKQAFAVDADKQSRALLAAATAPWRKSGKVTAVMVLNTCSWPRTDLVVIPREADVAGSVVKGPDGSPVPSQRLSGGELAFLAADVPALGAKRFTLVAGPAPTAGSAKAEGMTLSNATLTLSVDPATGAISSLKAKGIAAELVGGKPGMAVNDYFYVPGKNPADAQRAGQARITVKEPGPLVASLLVEGDAPGCRRLVREIRVVDGLDRVEISDTLDKEKVRTKEGVHVGFAFNVPDGVLRMDIPFAVVRPETDQLPGACKNFFTVERWIDVSSAAYGVTWATIDAPMVEVGAITAETPWMRTIEPSQAFYSYVMNNYWHTNYKADQEGPTPFRYALGPHAGGYCPVMATRFGVDASQPLVAVPTSGDGPAEIASRLRIEPASVIVTALKPTNDGKGCIVRLLNVGDKPAQAALQWSDPAPKALWMSNLAEEPLSAVTGTIEVPPMEIVTLRAATR